ncbi:hypothetical protein [Candidatus Regiella endosymbiont of Tuberolachnus salignus]|uniref:hypothetical protein n=1 Tax=Candidatus Regiella endosymbiont of Tuberolachnus salignus TaxID=3077956 RepID=UPI0030D0E052
MIFKNSDYIKNKKEVIMKISCLGFRPFTWVMTTIKKIKGSTLLINAKLEKTGNTPKQPYAKVFEIENPPRVKERTIFLSLEHSTEERMAFRSNRAHPTLDESKLKYFNSEKCTHKKFEDDKYTISSETEPSLFINEYKPGKWSFNYNSRESSEPFHASDIAVFQETKIAKENKFIGIVPSLIIRKEVTNPITLKKTEGKSGEELLRVFLEETPNGKSTQRILNEFGLKAIKVELYSVVMRS